MKLQCCFVGGADVQYNRFDVSSSDAPIRPPINTNSPYQCVVATPGLWRLSLCTDKHRVACQSGSYSLCNWKNHAKSCRSLLSKVDFGINRKRAWDILLVIHINRGPILHRYRYMTAFVPYRHEPFWILVEPYLAKMDSGVYQSVKISWSYLGSICHQRVTDRLHSTYRHFRL